LALFIWSIAMMKQIIREQYQHKFNQLVDINELIRPKEGWVRTLRKALGMSSPQMAKRLGMSKSQASQMERMEIDDRITLKQLRRVAGSFDCDLIYALVPRKPFETIIRDRAKYKAQKLVKKTDVQMKLEAQQLSSTQLDAQIEIEIERLVKEMPRNLWED